MTLAWRGCGVRSSHSARARASRASRPTPQLEIASGYRVGDLRDPDFAVNGGHGFFVTLGARLTERFVDNVADFWRDRFNKQ